MRITFLGGADEVGASGTLLEIGGRRLLVDAGIRLSPKARWGLAGDQLPDFSLIDRLGGIDAILVTHAHTDHTGAIELVSERCNCPVYATPPTIALVRVLHSDSRRIMQSRLEEEGELPLFDDVAVQKLLDSFVPVPFNTRLPLGDGLIATFFPAGHIAGAAMIGIESGEGSVLVTGDLSITPQRTVDGAKTPPVKPDVMIVESTYGGRLHANRAVEERRLAETVAQVTQAGGKVLIPAFALGRAQEVILALREARLRGEFGAPVWVDGMVRQVCAVYASFAETMPLAFQELGAKFFGEHVRSIQQAQQRDGLLMQAEPVVIVASSGMLSGGPSASYARSLAKQPQHAILLTGYQDEESPGRRLQEMAARGQGTLRLGKEKIDVQCKLGLYSLSAHADEGQLVNLVEVLDPGEVILVHGDADARASLSRVLGERGRSVHLPLNGQSLEFSFAPSLAVRRPERIGAGKPLDLRALWQGVAGPAGGGYFAADELSRVWWGDQDHIDELELELDKDDLYFLPDARRAGVYRARTKAQIELSLKRREAMATHADWVGHVLILRDPQGAPLLARCIALAPDHFYIEGDPSPRWPETILDVVGSYAGDLANIEKLSESLQPATLLPPDTPRSLDDIAASLDQAGVDGVAVNAAVALALLRAGAERTPEGYVIRGNLPHEAGAMEPNQALAFAREQFPSEARLRRCGYYLERFTIALAFDFPDAALRRYADILERLPAETGWQVEVATEPNQAALADLARDVAAEFDWRITKGPSVHREENRLAITVIAGETDGDEIAQACEQFNETTGYELSVSFAEDVPTAPSLPISSGQRWEINAAYAEIRKTLADSTLYRTSLKGDVIILSFISPQVGQRYMAEMDALSQKLGWPLDINPQPNQGEILMLARKLVTDAGWDIVKGPGIHVGRGEVEVRLDALPDEDIRAEIEAAFEQQTGYRLIFGAPASSSAPSAPKILPAIQVPLAKIELSAMLQACTPNEDKVSKAVARARRLGRIDPPVVVRRRRDSYLLIDGLYRLLAAQAMGWTHIAATVED